MGLFHYCCGFSCSYDVYRCGLSFSMD